MKLIFRDDVSIKNEPNEQTTLRWQMGTQPMETAFRSMPAGVSQAFQTMNGSEVTLKELVDIVTKEDGFLKVSQFYGYLKMLEQASLVHRVLPNGRGPFMTLMPSSPYYKYRSQKVPFEQNYILSRFAYWHREGTTFVLESPLGLAKVQLQCDDAMMLIMALQRPSSLNALAEKFPHLPAERLETIFTFLLNAKLLSEVDEDGQIGEETNQTLEQWEFHDLLFHTRSRHGRITDGYGGTFRFWGQIPTLPAVKEPMSDEYITLNVPDLDALAETDLPFTTIMETRRSIRAYDDDNPITKQQLGEFLYRVARVKRVFEYKDVKEGQPDVMELSQRPYPSGGSQYELELYLLIRHCEGINPGFYHYCPLNHRLYLIKPWNEQVAKLMKKGGHIASDPPPQILFTITSRFQRIAWKYESVAYAVMLKNCGSLYQTMYLVATSMGLAPCGIGGGDSELFSQITGIDYYQETSVGEFVLGSIGQ